MTRRAWPARSRSRAPAGAGAEDFLVSQSNQAAADIIDRWPDWPQASVVVVAPAARRQDAPRQRVAPEVGVRPGSRPALLREADVARAPAARCWSRTCTPASATSAPCSTCSTWRASTSCRCCSPRALPPGELDVRPARPALAPAGAAAGHHRAARRGPAQGRAGQAFRRPATRRGAARDQLHCRCTWSRSMEAAAAIVAEIDRAAMASHRKVTRALAAEVLARQQARLAGVAERTATKLSSCCCTVVPVLCQAGDVVA